MPRLTLLSISITVALAAIAGSSAAAQQSKPAAAQQQARPSASPTASAPSASPLPGGASSLSEQHGDWTVSCSVAQNVKQCVFSEVLGNSDTGRRTFAMQLRPMPDNKINGVAITQFGLRLDAGVRFTVDDKPLVGPMAFLTCTENGCLVPLSFDAAAVEALKSGATLKASAAAVNGGQPVVVSLSLKGFGDALARTAELLK
jgi:invasion protein IalB